MARQRQPIALLEAKGRKHLTKTEKEQRAASEVKPLNDRIEAPSYLLKKQKEAFDIVAQELVNMGIMGNTDCDALARYIQARDLHQKIYKQIKREELKDPDLLAKWMKNLNSAFSQCRQAANDLGLTIASRCRLVVPKLSEDVKPNKFMKFVA
ncbi:MAG: phage terminase small subunit P27 family [bacterium]|nr:phage terminase small subunit P27 family [bacterium]